MRDTGMFLGNDEMPPLLIWPDDRYALIKAVWRAGVATGRCLEIEDEMKRFLDPIHKPRYILHSRDDGDD